MPTRKQLALRLLGCGVVLALPVVGLLSLLGAAWPYAVGLLTLGVALPVTAVRRRRRALVEEFRARYGGEGKDLLLVYTDSPHWKGYVASPWLPRWRDRAVLLNRSQRWEAASVKARLWRNMAGSVEHTPVAIVVPGSGPPQIVRFWLAFRDARHGRHQRLRDAEARLVALLDRRAD